MLKYNAYMIIGKITLDYLHDKKNMVFDSDDIRRFNIGLLSIGNSKLCFIGKVLSFFSISNPYIMGYHLQKYIDDNISKNLKKCLSNNKKNNTDHIFEEKYKLVVPEITPFFSPSWCIDLCDYLSVQYEYKKCRIDKNTSDDIEALEKEFIRLADKFYKRNRFRIGKSLRMFFLSKKKSSLRWSADNTKKIYYRKQWKLICEEAYKGDDAEISNLNIFFDGIMEELDNILTQSNSMRRRWDKDEKKIIISSALITIIDAFAVAFNALNAENGSDCIQKCAVFLTIFATATAAVNSAFSLLKNHHAYRETWLRHQLNYSRLTAEIENFCECIGDYEINYNLIDGDNDNLLKKIFSKKKTYHNGNETEDNLRNKYKENISKFQKRIAELRKIDYENFFTNMDCINFNGERK